MTSIGEIFGQKKSKTKSSAIFTPAVLPPKKEPGEAPILPAQKPEDLSRNPRLIRIFDAHGHEVFISKDNWRKNILPDAIKANWNRPDALRQIVINSLHDRFFTEVLAAARQLHQIDPLPARGASLHAAILLKMGRLDEAEVMLQAHLQKHGEEGTVLTNLAKIQAERKDHAKAEETLWRGLEVDPNQKNALGWYEAIHRERAGELAGLEALSRVANLPGSWRAQLGLARAALKSTGLEAALERYRECLAGAGNPVPVDLLAQMCIDLSEARHLRESLELVEPHFVAGFHGLLVGNHLIRAHLELGQFDAARRLLNQLYAHSRIDWKHPLLLGQQIRHGAQPITADDFLKATSC